MDLCLKNEFNVSAIHKPNALTKKLKMNINDVLSIKMYISNTTGASNGLYARYIHIYNKTNGCEHTMSLNLFYNMLRVNFDLIEK
jgi:hypothetical protein